MVYFAPQKAVTVQSRHQRHYSKVDGRCSSVSTELEQSLKHYFIDIQIPFHIYFSIMLRIQNIFNAFKRENLISEKGCEMF